MIKIKIPAKIKIPIITFFTLIKMTFGDVNSLSLVSSLTESEKVVSSLVEKSKYSGCVLEKVISQVPTQISE